MGIRVKYRNEGIKVPKYSIVTDKRMTDVCIRLYIWLLLLESREERYKGDAYTGKELGIDRQSIRTAHKNLLEKGYVEQVWHSGGKMVLYITDGRSDTTEDLSGYKNVVGLLPAPSARKKKTHHASVYLVELNGTRYYKIGCSTNVSRRMKEFSCLFPEKADLICSITTDDMYTLESELHERFKDKRTNGEWFLLDDEDVEYIKGLANE